MRDFGPELREFGFWIAVKRFFKRRHIIQLAAYVVLALAVAYAINFEHTRANSQHTEITDATRQQFIASCERGNRLRLVLVGILKQERPQIASAVKRGQITPTEAAKFRVQLEKNIKTVGPVPCTVAKGLQ